MPLEIERRFLVRGEGWRDHQASESDLQQGYLWCGDNGLITRVRLQRDSGEAQRAWLTIKARPDPTGAASVCLEFEYPIPAEDAGALLQLAPVKLEKSRHALSLAGGDWVVDVFRGENAPLIMAEVELAHPDVDISVPPWCWKEVTGRSELSNAALAGHPLQRWQPEARERLWSD
ncbi:MAG: CYTH domain-containing protein [Cyanobacteriota bacterium]|nr:CYTH domain-containing protein [Cyanobacteriota bacterium]